MTIPALRVKLTAQPGKSASVDVTPDKAGEYEYNCSVAGHQEAGMQSKVVVSTGAGSARGVRLAQQRRHDSDQGQPVARLQDGGRHGFVEKVRILLFRSIFQFVQLSHDLLLSIGKSPAMRTTVLFRQSPTS